MYNNLAEESITGMRKEIKNAHQLSYKPHVMPTFEKFWES